MAGVYSFVVAAGVVALSAGNVSAAGNLALGRPVTASSVEAGTTLVAGNAVDGVGTTRWGSADPAPNPEWIYVDLGATTSIGRVVLSWEAAYAKAFQIQTSNDLATWTSIYSTTSGAGGVQSLTVSGSGRYVRMYATVRGTAYGYSLWEMEVYARTGATPTATATVPTSGNLALRRPVTTSSVEGSSLAGGNAVDGVATTRWASVEPAPNPEWISVDLGATSNIGRVVLNWEAAYAKAYQLQTSNDGANWTTIYSTTTGAGGIESLNVSGSGRYVRVYATVRGTAYGYSLWELEVYAGAGATATATKTSSPTSTRTATATVTPTGAPAGDGSNWKGHNWAITNGGMAGVAPGSPSNVFVDTNGFLHLRITKSGNTATAAEMFSQDRMGFGTYQWQIEGPLDNMDKSTVLGLFPYGPAAGIGGDGENEIDIEFSKWDNSCGGCNADFTYYPATGHGSLGPKEDVFTLNLGGSTQVTARTEWRSDRIVGTIMKGFVPLGTTTNVLHTFTFAPTDSASRIPQVALPLGMNLWSFQSQPGSSQEVVLHDFQYVP